MLTNKQRSFLRKLANSQDAIFQIGKGGIAPAMVKQVREALEGTGQGACAGQFRFIHQGSL